MDAFGPIVNVLLVLSVLSVAAERVTNLVKLRRDKDWCGLEARDRELRITFTNVLAGVTLAAVMKADLFGMLSQPSAPWSTLGWTQWNGQTWVRHAAASSVGGVTYALLGSAITGIALGFGSKFWHDVLGIVVELKKLTEGRSKAAHDASEAKVTVELQKKEG
jgi:hypothetical protein